MRNKRQPSKGRRGMALLLVMIGMIICSILTAGFLASQGTSIGIARNERDATKCRAIAQTGIDMVYWEIRNRNDWRSKMTPGTWLNNVPVGDGTVTVSVADGDSTGNFADDAAQPVLLTSIGTYGGRSYTLTADIRPTGGGTVFGNGNFINNTLTLGSDLLTAARIDSYDSSSGSAAFGANAVFTSNSNAVNSLIVYFPSVFQGSYIAGPNSLLGNVLSLIGLGSSGPTAMSVAEEGRNLGRVVFPNTVRVDATDRGAFSRVNVGASVFNLEGKYASFLTQSSKVTVSASGVYHFTGNFTIASQANSALDIADGVTAVLVIDGNLSIAKHVQLLGSARLAIYCRGTITVANSLVNTTQKGTSRLMIFGAETCSAVTITSASTVYGSIYAPQASMLMQTGSPHFYGAAAVKDMTMRNGSQLHFDEALRSLYLSNITGGSAPPGVADYLLTVNGGPGIAR